MAPCFPTQFELRLSGVSLIIATIFWIATFWILEIDHDLYKKQTNESVIALHSTLSSQEFRGRVEIACCLLWISFPLMLAAIHGIAKLSHIGFHETGGEVLVYIFEKAFILLVGIGIVFVPAILLTAVSFDWNYEPIGDDGIAPNGYWIQSYLIIYSLELMDCLAICDATFMMSYMGLSVFYVYVIHKKHHPLNKQFTEMDAAANSGTFRLCKYCVEVLVALFCCSLSIVFLFILFQFAESGFFSPTEDINASMLFMWSFLVKIIIGARHIEMAGKKKYHQLKRLFGGKHDHDHHHGHEHDDDQQEILSNGVDETYHMDTIDVEQGDNE